MDLRGDILSLNTAPAICQYLINELQNGAVNMIEETRLQFITDVLKRKYRSTGTGGVIQFSKAVKFHESKDRGTSCVTSMYIMPVKNVTARSRLETIHSMTNVLNVSNNKVECTYKMTIPPSNQFLILTQYRTEKG